MFSKFAEIINRSVERMRKRNLDTDTRKKSGAKSIYDDEMLAKAVAGLFEGSESWLPYVYTCLTSDNMIHVAIAANTVADYMKTLNIKKVMQLDDRFRSYTSMEYFINWKTVSPSDLKNEIGDEAEYLWVMRLGTFHPNGY